MDPNSTATLEPPAGVAQVNANGLLNGRASRDGVEKALRNRFLSVWVRQDGDFRMVAWQSTGA